MKKIITILILSSSLFAITSCSSSDDETDNTALLTDVGTSWINDYFEVGVENELINEDDVTEGTDHLEYYLPSDINASIRLVESVFTADDLYSADQSVYVTYLSTYNFDTDVFDDIASSLSSVDLSEIDVLSTYSVLDSAQTLLELSDEYKEDTTSNRVNVVAYLPINVQYITYNSDDSRFISLYTYVICPIYISTTYKTNDVYNDSVLNDSTAPFLEVTLESGLLA